MGKYRISSESRFLEEIEKHQGILNRICFIYSNSGFSRDDLYQEIILQLWKSYASFSGKSEFSTWMYRVALNTAITLTKKPSLFVSLDKAPEAYFDSEGVMNLSEDVKVLYSAISKLEKIEKAVILLWLEDRSYGEISEIVGISVKNVSVRLVRIRTKLAGLINKLQ